MKTDIQTPKYFDELSYEDQKSYIELRNFLSSKEYRNNRGHRLTKFSEILNAIQQFCIKNDENDVKRCMVCGVLWLPPKGIAINIRQLHLLLDKCKSSINGSLQRMGYNPLPPKNELVGQLIDLIPSLKDNFPGLREWTIRTLSVYTPQPEPIPMNSYQLPTNHIDNSKVNNIINKNIVPSMSMNSFAEPQINNRCSNFYSSFSSPQPNIFVNQFMPLQQPTNSIQESQKVEPVSNYVQTDLQQKEDNSFVNNSFAENDYCNYFDDPFCLPPSTLFGDEDENPFDSWSIENN